ncbi:MAG: EAL domain-containing protein [Actinomycetota bacterium]
MGGTASARRLATAFLVVALTVGGVIGSSRVVDSVGASSSPEAAVALGQASTTQRVMLFAVLFDRYRDTFFAGDLLAAYEDQLRILATNQRALLEGGPYLLSDGSASGSTLSPPPTEEIRQLVLENDILDLADSALIQVLQPFIDGELDIEGLTPEELLGFVPVFEQINESDRPYIELAEAYDAYELAQDNATRSTLIRAVLVAVWVAVAGVAAAAWNMFRRWSQREQQRQHAKLERVVDRIADVVLIVGADGSVVHATGQTERYLGLAADELEPTELVPLVHPDDRASWFGEIEEQVRAVGTITDDVRVAAPDFASEWTWMEIRATDLLDDPTVAGIVYSLTNIHSQKLTELRMEWQALHDDLTGLTNRAALTQGLEHDRARDRWLVFLDLDRFKFVNDSLGHDAGDQVLITLADRMRQIAGPDAMVSRLGSDEFVIVPATTTEAGALSMASNLASSTQQPIDTGKGRRPVRPSSSIGVAHAPVGMGGLEAIRRADIAVNEAKRSGGGIHLFDRRDEESARKRLSTEQLLRNSIEDEPERFIVHYQPQIDLRSGEWAGIEALVRWDHPERGVVLPGEFIELAEEIGLVHAIGSIVLRRACHDAVELRRRLGRDLRLGVNLSPRFIDEEMLQTEVADALAASGLPPSALVLEVTETALANDLEQLVRALGRVAERGVGVSIDDFGTGYASLTYLERLPVTEVKIDRSFVSKVLEDSSVVGAVLSMCTALGIHAVAEGVEEVGTAAALLEMGCPVGQGHLWSRARPVDELIREAVAS